MSTQKNDNDFYNNFGWVWMIFLQKMLEKEFSLRDTELIYREIFTTLKK